MEFMAGSQKERKEKESHIRETHTFKCTVCDLAHKNKEELDMHLITCELYVCSLCNYTHKRLSELRSHCKNKHTRNSIIKHRKMDRENFTKLSCTNYFSEEIWKLPKWNVCKTGNPWKRLQMSTFCAFSLILLWFLFIATIKSFKTKNLLTFWVCPSFVPTNQEKINWKLEVANKIITEDYFN